MEKHIGKVIKEVKIASDKMAILITFDDGSEVIGRTDAECCSHTWIEHIELPSSLPAKILTVGDISLNESLDTQDGEMSFYGYKISTDQGDLIIDYRNESNGYYGGSISFDPDDYFYGGVFKQNVSNNDWKPV